MDQEGLRSEMKRAAEVIIRTNRSANTVAYPFANARAPFEAFAELRKRRDAFFATSIMLLVAYLAGTGGPIDELGWFIPSIGFFAILCLGIAFVLEVRYLRGNSGGCRYL